MTGVRLGQQRSQAVGVGFESLLCQMFLRFFPQHLLIPEISEALKASFRKFFGTVRQKFFDEKL